MEHEDDQDEQRRPDDVEQRGTAPSSRRSCGSGRSRRAPGGWSLARPQAWPGRQPRSPAGSGRARACRRAAPSPERARSRARRAPPERNRPGRSASPVSTRCGSAAPGCRSASCTRGEAKRARLMKKLKITLVSSMLLQRSQARVQGDQLGARSWFAPAAFLRSLSAGVRCRSCQRRGPSRLRCRVSWPTGSRSCPASSRSGSERSVYGGAEGSGAPRGRSNARPRPGGPRRAPA